MIYILWDYYLYLRSTYGEELAEPFREAIIDNAD